jgi:hypothetical protein
MGTMLADMSRGETTGTTMTPAQLRFAKAMSEILVYIVVLNLFVEYVHTVVIDSFAVSVATAVVLWLILRVVVGLEHRVASYFSARPGVPARVLRYLSVWAILFSSKFVILEAVAIVTAGRAALGQFYAVVAITLALLGAEAGLRLVYRRLGRVGLEPRG